MGERFEDPLDLIECLKSANLKSSNFCLRLEKFGNMYI